MPGSGERSRYTYSILMWPSVKTYKPGEHRFFDSLVAFCASHASFALAFKAQKTGRTVGFEPNDQIGFGGNPEVTNVVLSLAPEKLLDTLSFNNWPNSLELQVEEPPQGKPLKQLPQIPTDHKLTGLRGLFESTLTPMFIDFYESEVNAVRETYGNDTTDWPDVWNFGRVVRNAFSHGGEVEIRNSNADPVEWNGLEYSASDNGRYLLFQDLATVEVIYLMEDMNDQI